MSKAAALCLSFFLLPFFSYAYRPMRGRTIETYIEQREQTSTPRKVVAFLNKRLTYIHDFPETFVSYTGKQYTVGNDYVYDPVDIYLRGGGDCDDYAALAADWLLYHGHEAHIIYLGKSSHAICAARDTDGWAYIGSNGGYFRGYHTLEKLVRQNAFSFEKSRKMIHDNAQETGFVSVPLPLPLAGRTQETYAVLKEQTRTFSSVRYLLQKMSIHHIQAPALFRTTQQPFLTYLYGQGTDHDLAVLAADILNHHKYETKVISYTLENNLTTVRCVAKENGKWMIATAFSQFYDYNKSHATIHELLNDWTGKQWVEYSELAVEKTQRFSIVETHRRMP